MSVVVALVTGCAGPIVTMDRHGMLQRFAQGAAGDEIRTQLGPPTQVRVTSPQTEIWVYAANGNVPIRVVHLRRGKLRYIRHLSVVPGE